MGTVDVEDMDAADAGAGLGAGEELGRAGRTSLGGRAEGGEGVEHAERTARVSVAGTSLVTGSA